MISGAVAISAPTAPTAPYPALDSERNTIAAPRTIDPDIANIRAVPFFMVWAMYITIQKQLAENSANVSGCPKVLCARYPPPLSFSLIAQRTYAFSGSTKRAKRFLPNIHSVRPIKKQTTKAIVIMLNNSFVTLLFDSPNARPRNISETCTLSSFIS